MELDSSERKQFHEALLSAFPDEASLERLVANGLGENLAIIAGSGGKLDVIGLNLISWAIAHDYISELIYEAIEANPNNRKLLNFMIGWADQRGKTEDILIKVLPRNFDKPNLC